MDDAAHGPASLTALRDAVRNGREPPPARIVARLKSYRWFVVGTVCVGAFMGQVDSSIAQMLLPRLELKFDARLQHRELGRGCPSLGNGGVPADLRSARRQAPVTRAGSCCSC